MKSTVFFLFIVFLIGCSQNNEPSHEISNEFYLSYIYAGLGSGMGSKQPSFVVTGNEFLYTSEQNSYYEKQTLDPDTICKGIIRQSSIDSIIQIIGNVEDTLIYNTNAGVSSDGIHYIYIKSGDKDLKFSLHNASDSTAKKIVEILNSNIPIRNRKLFLFDENFLNSSEEDMIDVLVVVCANGYDYSTHGYDLDELIEKELSQFDGIQVKPFPFKTLMGVPYQGVFDKKYCAPIIEKVDVDYLILNRFDKKYSNKFRLGNSKWGYETRIVDTQTLEQINSISAHELMEFKDIEKHIKTNIQRLKKDIQNLNRSVSSTLDSTITSLNWVRSH